MLLEPLERSHRFSCGRQRDLHHHDLNYKAPVAGLPCCYCDSSYGISDCEQYPGVVNTNKRQEGGVGGVRISFFTAA